MSLNPEQLAAVKHKDGPALLLAGPGSGKTSVVTARYAALLRAGLRPGQICCLTFSKDAAAEMRARIEKLTGFSDKTLKDSVSTFHSLAYRLVIREREALPFALASYPILGEGQDKKILRDIVRKDLMGIAKAYIGRQRRALIAPPDAVEQSQDQDEAELAHAYLEYDKALREEGLLDFDAMVYWAVYILRHSRHALLCENMKWRHIICDEAHDTSPDQKTFADMLAGEDANLMWVLDKSQAIYLWRGATPELIVEDSDRKKCYFLGSNYRCGAKIIEAFKPFAEQDELSRKLVDAMRSETGEDGEVVVNSYVGEYEQANQVVNEIAASGVDYVKCGVLARTKGALLPYCEILEEKGIPYFWRSKNFWLSPEIQDAVAFCRFAIDKTDREAFVRICCSQALEFRYIGQKFGECVASESMRKQVSPLAISDVPGTWASEKYRTWDNSRIVLQDIVEHGSKRPAEFLRDVQSMAGLSFYDSQNEQPDDFQRENIEALIRRSERFGSIAEFVIHAKKMSRRSARVKGVTLSTIHSAKGLEWDSVFVVSVNEGVLPHKRSNDPDEERRLMYVALSRARKFLWASSYGKASFFLKMIPDEVKSEYVAERAFALTQPGEAA